jgi:putative tricarboxylic transport membrane protein
LKVREKQDFYAGLVFIVFGLIFALVAKNYPMGTAVRMGPAYFPTILGWILVILGAITTGRAFIPQVRADAVPELVMRPLFWITLSVVVFGMLVDWVGVIIATTAMTFISCVAGWEYNWKEAAILSVVLCVMTVAIFVWGLGLPFRLWPSFG